MVKESPSIQLVYWSDNKKDFFSWKFSKDFMPISFQNSLQSIPIKWSTSHLTNNLAIQRASSSRRSITIGCSHKTGFAMVNEKVDRFFLILLSNLVELCRWCSETNSSSSYCANQCWRSKSWWRKRCSIGLTHYSSCRQLQSNIRFIDFSLFRQHLFNFQLVIFSFLPVRKVFK